VLKFDLSLPKAHPLVETCGTVSAGNVSRAGVEGEAPVVKLTEADRIAPTASPPTPDQGVPPGVRRAVLAAAVVLAVAGSFAAAFSPYLLVEHPLLLVAGSAVNRHILLAAAVVDPLPLWVVGSLRRMAALMVTYGLGYLYAAVALQWAKDRSPWIHRLARWLQRLIQRWGAILLVPFSSYTLVALAGATRMSLRPFIVAATVGNLLYVAALVWLGDIFADWSRELIGWLSDHVVESTVVCVLLVAVQQWWSRASRSREAAAEEAAADADPTSSG
jgi:membrane protein DedA with SNARE-associated domain